MQLREALIQQNPSLALQRAAADEIARLDAEVARALDLLGQAGTLLVDAAPSVYAAIQLIEADHA